MIDTTNPFEANGLADLGGLTSAQYNAARLPGARPVKAFNTLTAGFQARAAGRTGADRVVMFYVTDDPAAGDVAARVIDAAGFAPVSLGGLADSAPMEAPRRPGAVYGEEWNPAQALAFAQLWRQTRTGGPDSFVRRYIRAFATADLETLRTMYADDVVLYTPLAWGARGWPFVAEFITAFHTANPGMRTTLHDEFYDPTGTRACFRFVLHWHNTGPFFGHPPTGDRGTMSETHAIRIEDGRIVEQWVGDNSFQLPYQELVQFGMDFPRDTPDPYPALLDLTAPPVGGA
ncbi:MAG TPA: ester cyclase [Actinophytocola sp.]|uniref:ester cyclase n=1 Tax=Actinophytocola sp. TaxID=1872138 RepID=UPI002DDCB919|nr:ester cyclase [Actinophytocola sp.]HEV2779266.1 ester cyclase [Actinophytocola sp.]